MRTIAVIPARYEASRFPGKLMKDLGGKPVIIRTMQATQQTGLFDDVMVATDSETIYKTVEENGGKAVMSTKNHECGSDRIAEAVENISADIVINVQGDEPFTNKEDLASLIEVFKNDPSKNISLASLMHEIKGEEMITNPNNVKVIVDENDHAIYFSRSPIPYHRDKLLPATYYKHIGIYAFRKQALLDFYRSKATPLELLEKLECLRYIEQGKKIKMVRTQKSSIGIDTPDDLIEANKLWDCSK